MFASVYRHWIITDFNYLQVHKDGWEITCMQCYFKGIIHFPKLLTYGCAAVALMRFELFSLRRLKTGGKTDTNYQLSICKVWKSSSVRHWKRHRWGQHQSLTPVNTKTGFCYYGNQLWLQLEVVDIFALSLISL